MKILLKSRLFRLAPVLCLLTSVANAQHSPTAYELHLQQRNAGNTEYTDWWPVPSAGSMLLFSSTLTPTLITSTSLSQDLLTLSTAAAMQGALGLGLPAGQLLVGNGTGAVAGASLGQGVSLAGGVLNVVVPKIYDVILNYNGSGCGMTTTTASLTLGNSAVTASSSWTWLVGEGITVPGAGAGGIDLVSTVTGIAPGATVTVSGCTSASNSTTLTVSSAAGLAAGMSVTGPGIWPGATVGSISGTGIALANPYDPFLATPSATITGTLTAVFVGAGTLTISGTAATGVSAVVIRHNDLAAINAACAAATFNQTLGMGGMTVGGSVFLSAVEALDGSGIYEVEGPWNATASSLISFPAFPTPLLPATAFGNAVQIAIRGEKRGVLDPKFFFAIGGVDIDASHQSGFATAPTGAGIFPAVISTGPYTVGGATFSATDLYTDNLIIQLPSNPTFGGIWMGGSLRGSTGDKVGIWAQATTSTSSVFAQPTSAYSFGIGFPQDANNVQNVCGQDEAVGVYYGFIGGEHVRLDRPVAFFCEYALYVPTTAGIHTIVGAIDSENTAFAIGDSGGTPLDLDLNIETDNAIGSFWYAQQPGGGFVTSVNPAVGQVRYSLNSGGSLLGGNGWGTPLDRNGGQAVRFVNLNDSPNKPKTPMLQYNLGSVTDSSGNQNLTNGNSVTFTTSSGLSGATHAAIFNGTSQYLEGSTQLGLVPWGVFGGGQYTFTGWFNTSTTATQVIVGEYDNSSLYGGWQIYLASGKLTFDVLPSYAPTTHPSASMLTTTTLSTNAWHFYVAQLDGQLNTITLSVDGGAPGSTTFSGAIVCPAVPLTFGDNWNYPSTLQSFYFKGMMSNWRMYDYLLTNQQIANIYNGGQGTEVAAPANLAETGTATLASGAVTVTAAAALATSIISLTPTALNATTTLGQLMVTPGTGTFSITSQTATGSTQTGDLRTVNWSMRNATDGN